MAVTHPGEVARRTGLGALLDQGGTLSAAEHRPWRIKRRMHRRRRGQRDAHRAPPGKSAGPRPGQSSEQAYTSTLRSWAPILPCTRPTLTPPRARDAPHQTQAQPEYWLRVSSSAEGR
ncbi:hypothetical protein [Streptomyces sp. SCL15-4]|uniref:hypothetical protein n=1 Tax=Streptomyces sp. SCL15-4 TaxID=2967221 RepID=UPI002966B46C|nr:hypothetical protein [Streptomyces sp. SCL15-4]